MEQYATKQEKVTMKHFSKGKRPEYLAITSDVTVFTVLLIKW
jgi:hypothetical protein